MAYIRTCLTYLFQAAPRLDEETFYRHINLLDSNPPLKDEAMNIHYHPMDPVKCVHGIRDALVSSSGLKSVGQHSLPRLEFELLISPLLK